MISPVKRAHSSHPITLEHSGQYWGYVNRPREEAQCNVTAVSGHVKGLSWRFLIWLQLYPKSTWGTLATQLPPWGAAAGHDQSAHSSMHSRLHSSSRRPFAVAITWAGAGAALMSGLYWDPHSKSELKRHDILLCTRTGCRFWPPDNAYCWRDVLFYDSRILFRLHKSLLTLGQTGRPYKWMNIMKSHRDIFWDLPPYCVIAFQLPDNV